MGRGAVVDLHRATTGSVGSTAALGAGDACAIVALASTIIVIAARNLRDASEASGFASTALNPNRS